MTSKYKINPCRACEKKLSGSKCNVNTMNDCCYGTLAAFSGATSSNAINNDEAANNCKACVQKVMNGMGVFGRTPCDLKLSAPPIWLQSPHYVPTLLNEGKTPDEARCECMRLCRETKYPQDCQLNCQTDYDAIEQLETPSTMSTLLSIPESDSDHKRFNLILLIVGLFLLLVIFVFALKK